MPADNPARRKSKAPYSHWLGFMDVSFFSPFFLTLFVFAPPMRFVQKDVLLQKENDQIDRKFPPSKTKLYFLLNVTKSKILVNASISFFF